MLNLFVSNLFAPTFASPFEKWDLMYVSAN